MRKVDDREKKQAGAELGQAQLKLELGFTSIKICCITLMITNYLQTSYSGSFYFSTDKIQNLFT